MAHISINCIDPIIRGYAEGYSVEDLFKVSDLKQLFENGGTIATAKDRMECIETYLRFTAHKLVFQGGLDLELKAAAAIGCGVNIDIPQFRIPDESKVKVEEFCRAYVRTAVALGYEF